MLVENKFIPHLVGLVQIRPPLAGHQQADDFREAHRRCRMQGSVAALNQRKGNREEEKVRRGAVRKSVENRTRTRGGGQEQEEEGKV